MSVWVVQVPEVIIGKHRPNESVEDLIAILFFLRHFQSIHGKPSQDREWLVSLIKVALAAQTLRAGAILRLGCFGLSATWFYLVGNKFLEIIMCQILVLAVLTEPGLGKTSAKVGKVWGLVFYQEVVCWTKEFFWIEHDLYCICTIECKTAGDNVPLLASLVIFWRVEVDTGKILITDTKIKLASQLVNIAFTIIFLSLHDCEPDTIEGIIPEFLLHVEF